MTFETLDKVMKWFVGLMIMFLVVLVTHFLYNTIWNPTPLPRTGDTIVQLEEKGWSLSLDETSATRNWKRYIAYPTWGNRIYYVTLVDGRVDQINRKER